MNQQRNGKPQKLAILCIQQGSMAAPSHSTIFWYSNTQSMRSQNFGAAPIWQSITRLGDEGGLTGALLIANCYTALKTLDEHWKHRPDASMPHKITRH
eukprot:1147004-Pelagomonas_calceolata.AAC.3